MNDTPPPDPPGTADLVIERASLDDVESLIGLQRAAFASEGRIYGPQITPLRETPDQLRAVFGEYCIWKATLGGRLVGQIRARPDASGCCQIGRLSVAPEYQRRGIASQLIQQVHSHFGDSLVYEIFTGDRSLGNQALYRSLGYRETDRIAHDGIVAVVMRRTGSDGI